jgi:hypothetical protein
MIEPHAIGEHHLHRRETGRLSLVHILARTLQWDRPGQDEMHDPHRGPNFEPDDGAATAFPDRTARSASTAPHSADTKRDMFSSSIKPPGLHARPEMPYVARRDELRRIAS